MRQVVSIIQTDPAQKAALQKQAAEAQASLQKAAQSRKATCGGAVSVKIIVLEEVEQETATT